MDMKSGSHAKKKVRWDRVVGYQSHGALVVLVAAAVIGK